VSAIFSASFASLAILFACPRLSRWPPAPYAPSRKKKMLQMLRKKNKTSNSLVAYLLSSVKNYQDHVADLLTSSAEQRLARVLLRLAHLDKKGPAVVEIPILSHQVLAEMVGTTRPRVNMFMNRFRKKGFIDYDGGLEVRQSLRKVLRSH
jgi:CRP-like cAMP-binding protein